MSEEILSAMAQMLRAQNIDPTELAEFMVNAGGGDQTGTTMAEFVDAFLASQDNDGTRGDYRPHLRRLVDGAPRQCECTCAACVDEWVEHGCCQCECSTCAKAVSFDGLGEVRLRPGAITLTMLKPLPEIAQRSSQKKAVHDNRKRARKGLAAKPTHGQGGREMCVTALRGLFNRAVDDDLLTKSPAAKLTKGARSESHRRAATIDELAELFEVTVLGGDDPELDLALVWSAFETAARRGGLQGMKVGGLRPDSQEIVVFEKGRKERAQPCSAELIEFLLGHAATRAGARCVPGHPDYDPASPVLYFKDSTPEKPHPVSGRRFDTLYQRIQLTLPWANESMVCSHAVRHTSSTLIERIAGFQVAQKFLGHGPNRPTDGYTKATKAEVVAAVSTMTGRPHPAITSPS